MNFSMRIMLLMLIGISTRVVFAGEPGWVSGGGELLRDAQNPWYLANTKEVTFCAEIDEVNFGLKKEKILEMFPRAFLFWKKQFSKNIQWRNENGFSFVLGTQSFIYQTHCTPETDMRFQFGVLNPDQFEYLKGPRDLVGVAVRTHYDSANLRGKGFIYISPERGPLAMNIIPHQNQGPWSRSEGALLYPVILHEIGHIFGLRHDPADFLMNAWAPEMCVRLASDGNEDGVNFYKDFYQKDHWSKLNLFSFNNDLPTPMIMQCSTTSSSEGGDTTVGGKANKAKESAKKQSLYDRFFEIDRPETGAYCVSTEFIKGKLQISVGTRGSHLEIIGYAELSQKGITTGFNTSIANFWLPEEQKVVPPCRNQYCYRQNPTFDVGWAEKGALLKGTWHNIKTGTQRPIFIQAHSPFLATIGGLMDGEIYLDLGLEF